MISCFFFWLCFAVLCQQMESVWRGYQSPVPSAKSSNPGLKPSPSAASPARLSTATLRWLNKTLSEVRGGVEKQNLCSVQNANSLFFVLSGLLYGLVKIHFHPGPISLHLFSNDKYLWLVSLLSYFASVSLPVYTNSSVYSACMVLHNLLSIRLSGKCLWKQCVYVDGNTSWPLLHSAHWIWAVDTRGTSWVFVQK